MTAPPIIASIVRGSDADIDALTHCVLCRAPYRFLAPRPETLGFGHAECTDCGFLTTDYRKGQAWDLHRAEIRRGPVTAVPPQLRRGRHSVARVHNLGPTRIEILSLRAAAFFADRMRPEHLDIVRARVAKWSAIALPVALYLVIAAGAVVGAVGR